MIILGALSYGKCANSITLSKKIDDQCEEHFLSAPTATGNTPSEKCRYIIWVVVLFTVT